MKKTSGRCRALAELRTVLFQSHCEQFCVLIGLLCILKLGQVEKDDP